ncbi:hypothetical protein A2U01_0110916 [Trifolium medium]|uniref:Uncharacterized protein n=1 Tax=Trifolium medium TaxID=97028 RepID=A0A392VP19_9FABA|nr:hypothetical protein [Trifolium medium]
MQLSMTPVEDEPEAAHGLTTRPELVEKIRGARAGRPRRRQVWI